MHLKGQRGTSRLVEAHRRPIAHFSPRTAARRLVDVQPAHHTGELQAGARSVLRAEQPEEHLLHVEYSMAGSKV